MFSICGACGDLSVTPNGPPVDYGSTEPDDVPYYYTPLGNCVFVDYKGLNDRITTTNQTRRRAGFREDVIRRDGPACVITRGHEDRCDAIHLIPRSKGDEYILRVVRDRSALYDPSPPSISGIDDVRNGMLLRKDLHSALAKGDVAFLKTPNYGLEPSDIMRVGPERPDHFTLQQLKKSVGDNPTLLAMLRHMPDLNPAVALELGAQVDAEFQDPENLLPPAIILDYVYGVAAYNCWGNGEGDDLMENYRREHYENISPLPRSPTADNDYSSPEEKDDPKDPDYIPGGQRRPYMSIRRGDTMARAMDKLNSVLMSLHGITPQEAANRREKRMEEEELKAQEASRSKVMGWVKSVAVIS